MKTLEERRASVLRALGSWLSGQAPENLPRLACRISDLEPGGVTAADVAEMLRFADLTDILVKKLIPLIVDLDTRDESEPWTKGTPKSSNERRGVVVEAIGLNQEGARLIAEFAPVVEVSGPTIVHEPFVRWYEGPRVSERSFYWSNYERFLREVRHWPEGAIGELRLATERIVGLLADPLGAIPTSRRGLVVGYVQSGKTANYTGVIARAIDVGYRLVIVLTGMQEPLRKQTQRRIDMELLGRRNILLEFSERGALGSVEGEYLADPSWDLFNDLGGDDPDPLIERLTSFTNDFAKGSSGRLAFKMPGDVIPLHDPRALFRLPARIAIVKKNQAVLGHLISAMRANKTAMQEIPALIIDDESDQASVNTARPAGSGNRSEGADEASKVKRKRINQQISSMLGLMPRVQYVGYTATPFANVLVDPSDVEDIFPRDFIVALKQPSGYMGAREFFDDASDSTNFSLTAKDARVRELLASDSDVQGQRTELQGALAAFIVTGAIKLFRASRDTRLAKAFRHHTMLVHETHLKSKHADTAERIEKLWESSSWTSPGGTAMLRSAFDDFRPTLEDRRVEGVPFVDDFDEIEPYLEEAIRRIEAPDDNQARISRSCVVKVNSDTDYVDRLNFDRRDTWKVVVGGAMLSRGFTIEGLTISYFRRLPKAHDTLLQMGRWFGYRPGYSDLVRLYLAANATLGKSLSVSLYDAFVEMARNEEEFRDQLAKYAVWDGDTPLVTPRDVRPLVLQSLPWLKPTAANKMYNARIVSQRSDVFTPKAMVEEQEGVARNWAATLPVLQAARESVSIELASRRFSAYVGVITVDQLVGILLDLEYMDDYKERLVRPRAAYYERASESGVLKDFIVIVPQIGQRGEYLPIQIQGIGERSVVKRSRGENRYYAEFTDPEHRRAALAFLEHDEGAPSSLMRFAAAEGRGIVLVYVVPEEKLNDGAEGGQSPPIAPETCTVSLNIYLPAPSTTARGPRVIEFEAIDRSEG